MTATRQMAIILAPVAHSEIKFERMATVWEKGSRFWILFILSSDFETVFESLFSWIAESIQCFHINFILFCSDWYLHIGSIRAI